MSDLPPSDMMDEIPQDMSRNEYPTYKEESALVADDPNDDFPMEENHKVQRNSKAKSKPKKKKKRKKKRRRKKKKKKKRRKKKKSQRKRRRKVKRKQGYQKPLLRQNKMLLCNQKLLM